LSGGDSQVFCVSFSFISDEDGEGVGDGCFNNVVGEGVIGEYISLMEIVEVKFGLRVDGYRTG
jgi:hypothetical protein